jgi:hypothetical protein
MYALESKKENKRQIDSKSEVDFAPLISYLGKCDRNRLKLPSRINGRAEIVRRKTDEDLKPDVVKAKRGQRRFAKELRKLGLVN